MKRKKKDKKIYDTNQDGKYFWILTLLIIIAVIVFWLWAVYQFIQNIDVEFLWQLIRGGVPHDVT